MSLLLFGTRRLTAMCVAGALIVCARSMQAQGDGVTRYRVTSSSVISLDRAPSPSLVDTVTTSLLLGIEISAGIDTVATLTIDSLQLVSTGMIRRAPDAFSRGISVSALLHDGRPQVTGDSASACTAERPMAGLLPELLPMLPTPLRADQQWSDTLTVTTCRAGLPVTTVTIAAYRTLSGMDSTSVLLERRAVIRAVGGSILREQVVTLEGTGTSESMSVVLLEGRRVQSWRGTQSLDIQLSNGQQVRRMSQQLSESAAIIP